MANVVKKSCLNRAVLVKDFSEICKDWEMAADEAKQAGVRTIHLRTGIVLSAVGGALEKMLSLSSFQTRRWRAYG